MKLSYKVEINAKGHLALTLDTKQLTLGQLISKLEKLELIDPLTNYVKPIKFDFSTAVPTLLRSWRGSYSELALGFELGGHDRGLHFCQPLAKEILEHLKQSVNLHFFGYKGGEYLMGEDTPIWVDNYGNCNNTGIVDVIEYESNILLITRFCKF